MIDPKQLSTLQSDFGEKQSETAPVSNSLIVRDVGAALFEEASQRGLHTLAMPTSYRRLYHHYGGLSWLPTTGSRGRKKIRDQRVVERRLRRLQLVQGPSNVPSQLLARVQLAALHQEVLDLAFRITARLLRTIRGRRDPRAA